MKKPQNRNLDAALRYLDFGWAPIPLASHSDPQVPKDKRGKRPLLKGWQKYTVRLPTEAEVRSSFRQNPKANVGVVCGPASGILILDVDGPEGEASLQGREVPETPIVRTGSGGRHLYFRHPGSMPLKNGVKLLPGLDVRTAGGAGVLPPSIHVTGNHYSWEIAPPELYPPGNGAPPAVPLADPPAWLLELAKKEERPQAAPVTPGQSDAGRLSRATRDFLAVGAVDGERNQSLYNAACDMAGCGYSKVEAEPLLLEGARRCSPPPEDETEVRNTIRSAFSQPRTPARPDDQSAGSQTATRKLQTHQSATGQGPRQPSSDQSAAPIGGQQPQTGQKPSRLSAASLRAGYTPTLWLVDLLLALGGVGLLAGIPGIGKTWLVLALAYAIATGGRLLDQFDCRQGRVLLVLGEEDPNSVVERLDLLYAGLGLNPEEADKLPVEFLIQQGIQVVDSERNLDPVFEQQVREFQPNLLIIDPLRRVQSLDENDSGAMSRLFSVFRQITQIPDNLCSVLLVHHLRKKSEFDGGGGLDRLRGSSDIAASVDTVLEVTGELETTLRVKHSKSKRGPSQGVFLVQTEITDEAVKLSYLDPDEKAQEDQAEARAFVVRTLKENPEGLNQSALAREGKKIGIGKDRLKAVCEALGGKGLVEVASGPRNSKIYTLSDQFAIGGRPPIANNSKEVEGEDLPDWVTEDLSEIAGADDSERNA